MAFVGECRFCCLPPSPFNSKFNPNGHFLISPLHFPIRTIIISASAKPRRPIKGGARKRTVVEEDLYTIGKEDEKLSHLQIMEIAGLNASRKLEKQLKEEKRTQSTKTESNLLAEPQRTTHKLLRVLTGKVAGKKLLSPADMNVRPMMEVVRGAVFNMLQAMGGFSMGLRPGRWLDLYSGTGSVGIEALSRGCAEAHFVEMDPWVVNNVLEPNLEATSFTKQATIYTIRVEDFLKLGSKHGPYDYVSVTPPYEAVSYPVLMDELSKSGILGESTCMVVEYPLQSKQEMPDVCGPISKIQDRRYGRTNVAVYGPSLAKTP